MRIVALLFLTSTLSLAGTWTGTLVDARCWGYAENDVGQKTTLQYVDRDRNLEVRLCSPTAKTKTFAVIPPDGIGLTLDANGSAKAAALMKSAPKHAVIGVTVSGERSRDTIQVSSIAAAR